MLFKSIVTALVISLKLKLAIVLLTLGEDIKVGLYTEDDEYPNIKLNKRTSKYLLDYPELDKIPLKNLFKLTEDGIIDKSKKILKLD